MGIGLVEVMDCQVAGMEVMNCQVAGMEVMNGVVRMEAMAGVESCQVMTGQDFGPVVYIGIGTSSLEPISVMLTLIRDLMNTF